MLARPASRLTRTAVALALAAGCGSSGRVPRWAGPPTPPVYHPVEGAFDRERFTVTPVDGSDGLVVCPLNPAPDASQDCLCVEPLRCCAQSCTAFSPQSADCIGFDRNLEVFERALDEHGDRLGCEAAETGFCGPLRTFYFRDNLYRDELRFFGEEGRLVAMLEATDYHAYCEHRTRIRFQGRLPDCPRIEVDRRMCGDPANLRGSPAAILRAFLE